jgi:hypothetical protein
VLLAVAACFKLACHARLLRHILQHSPPAPVTIAVRIPCRLNRAACHSKLEAFDACTQDCDHVVRRLEAAEPAVRAGRHTSPEAWKRMYVKALTRRSAALAQIGAALLALFLRSSWRGVKR